MAMEDPRDVLRELGIRPSKSRGQHFLVDARVAHRALGYADLHASDVVLEIGPGLGVLTRELVPRVKRVVAIESDRRLAEYLRRAIPDAEIIHGDALKVDWPDFDVMVSNLPYQISSPLTFRLLSTPFDRAVLMYQWEFAKRMVAAPGTADYSRLSVGVYVRAACRMRCQHGLCRPLARGAARAADTALGAALARLAFPILPLHTFNRYEQHIRIVPSSGQRLKLAICQHPRGLGFASRPPGHAAPPAVAG